MKCPKCESVNIEVKSIDNWIFQCYDCKTIFDDFQNYVKQGYEVEKKFLILPKNFYEYIKKKENLTDKSMEKRGYILSKKLR